MAQFDFYRLGDSDGYLVDCQADVMAHFDTRLVVPLLPLDSAPKPAAQLNPVFEVDGKAHSFVAQFAGAIPLNELGAFAGSLENERYRIGNAMDFLLTGV